jgi:hypothetical protein
VTSRIRSDGLSTWAAKPTSAAKPSSGAAEDAMGPAPCWFSSAGMEAGGNIATEYILL